MPEDHLDRPDGPRPRASQDAARIGRRLRDRRKLRGLSLRDVAGRAGISLGQLSQIERGLSVPSLDAMIAICAGMDMPVSWLFDNAGPGGGADDEEMVVRRAKRRILDLGAKGMVKEMLTPDHVRDVQMMRIVIRPGGSTGETAYAHAEGAKCGTVLSGMLSLEIDGRVHLVRSGDSFAFPATAMIRFWNDASEDAEVIWVGSPAFY
ncbi:XRE family transcriptional regulator [Palleronia aestuarii]|uniref:XRE family transcriptional regulator n=1 Tax=Palleronia aestuarii TaxID=568105 RepID=A0A2W7MZ64_9RHOB|nr:XRE family transcriptional regulator [Palleronia aestuarii]PZX13100.1 XRE family transcriptional regulator [Palleronia aestuarii]